MSDKKKPQPIIIVQGAQWGSEGKGMVTAALCSTRDVDYAVRTGAVNAGHTVVRRDGKEFKMQQIPCGFLNPKTTLVIGAGAFIEPRILCNEIKMLRENVDPYIERRIVIDYRCGIHLPEHQNKAQAANRHHKMGATGKGCSEAMVAKIRERGQPNPLLFQNWLNDWGSHTFFNDEELHTMRSLATADTSMLLNDAYDRGKLILIEGTQGTLLDLHLGPYPYTTNKQTIASQWVTECGLSPSLQYEVALVARTFPIRVAGNSGPMPNETSWPKVARNINSYLLQFGQEPRVREESIVAFERACSDVAQEWMNVHAFGKPVLPMNDTGTAPRYDFHNWTGEMQKQYQVAVSELHAEAIKRLAPNVLADLSRIFELTTVTKKLRRIAEWDTDTMAESIAQNRPAYLVLTFLNHWVPTLWSEARPKVVLANPDVRSLVRGLEAELEVPVRYVTTGPMSEHFIEVDWRKADNAQV